VPLLKFLLLFRCVFEAIFKIKGSRIFIIIFFHKLYVLLMFSCLICMDFVAHYIFFDLYGLVFCLDDLYGVFSGFISSRCKI
jgi:hypothetical protein